MNILEELWYGNICPNEQYVRNDSEYIRAMHKVVKEKERLLSSLSPEIQPAIETLLGVQLEVETIVERDAFVLGFRLAMRIMVDSLHKPLPLTR